MESFHYKTLTEKLTTEIAIVKYVSARPDSKRMIQEKAKTFKRELVYPDEDCSDGDDIINNGDNITNDGDNVTNDGEDISRDGEDVTYEDISNEQKPTGCVANCNDSPEAPAWELPIDAASPVVSQLRLLVKQCFSSDDTNTPELCFEFPSLLSNPEFEPLVQTYLR